MYRTYFILYYKKQQAKNIFVLTWMSIGDRLKMSIKYRQQDGTNRLNIK